MDDTQMSRVSDAGAAAAATRKRRSSILKSQRPPRTPFSELEFHVATPTDSTKSRRVSFSRRTGVAEFATNEATTTWKNFYEEHNKSLETSGEGRAPVAHLGQRAFDRQFESELEADFIGSLNTRPPINISSSFNNFEQQLASLECTDDIKLTAPHNNFELSAFTNTNTKIFDDLAISSGEVTDRINVNFSAIQQIGGDDDLDAIQNDIKQNFGNAPFQRQSISEYIEVDLNMTNVMNNEGDMSITDTIHSPKVQDLSKNNSSKNLDKDWVFDKENVAFNPYAAPRETENFAVNEDLDKVLVFDGKRLTIQSEKIDKDNYRKTLLPNVSDKAPQRKTIILNVNDDLPNFIDDPIPNNSGFLGVTELKKSIIVDDMSITEPLEGIHKQNTMYDDELGNISETQAVPSAKSEEGHRTVLYEDNGNISITKAIPTNIIAGKRQAVYDDNIYITEALPATARDLEAQSEKRKTIVFDDGDISVTQALPANILPNNSKRRTIVYEDNTGNLSITQAVPNILIKEVKADKRRTIVYEDETGNISVTQAIPSNIILAENCDRRRTVVFESDTGNISVTQAVPSNLVLQEQMNINSQAKINTQAHVENTRRRTIVYENDAGNLSMTLAVPNQVIHGMSIQNLRSAQSNEPTDQHRTIVYQNDDGDVSVTKAVSLNQVICSLNKDQKSEVLRNDTLTESQMIIDVKKNMLENHELAYDTNKRKTVVFDNEEADISMTLAVPVNVIHNQAAFPSKTELKRRTVVFNNDEADISITQAVNSNQLISGVVQSVHDDFEAAVNEALHNKGSKNQKTIEYDKENTNLTQNDTNAISLSYNSLNNANENSVKRRTVVFEDNNISMTQALPVNIIKEIADRTTVSEEFNPVRIHDVSSIEMDVEKDNTEKVTKVIQKSFSPEHSPVTATKPIPSNLSTIVGEDSKYKLNKYPSVELNPKSISHVVVYQAAMSKRTEQGDSVESQEQVVIENDENMSSSSKIADGKKPKDDRNMSSPKLLTEIDVEKSSDSASHELLIEKQISEIHETPLIQNETEQTHQSDMNDVQSDTTSQISKSILEDLLDMSSTECVEDKGLIAQVEVKETGSDHVSTVPKPCTATNSNDTLFYITKDADDEVQIQTEKCDSTELAQLTDNSPQPLEYQQDEPEIIVDLQNKLQVLKEAINGETSPKNRHYEKVLSSDINNDEDKEIKKSKETSVPKENNNFKTANDTKELLEMLSDLTDKTTTCNLDTHLEEDEEVPEPILIKGHLALENKSEAVAPKRLSFAPTRQSIVMSREDLLNNISLAGRALESRFDGIDLEDSIEDSPEENSPKKSVRLSNEVVKTLHFDESASDASIHDAKMTPLKKTAFGETSYMQEHKVKVIPDFLKDVSDDLKELMDDLVKPNVDIPFEVARLDKGVKKIPSTCSTQIQANLITSSQIDINTGLYSNPDSVYDVNINKISSVDMINDAVNRSVSRALKSPIKSATTTRTSEKSFTSKMDSSLTEVHTIVPSKPTEQLPGRVLIFDHNNPLNNVLLAPDTFTDVHKYNPGLSTETMISERSHSVQMSINERDNYEIERVSTQYNVGNLIHTGKQSGDASSGKIVESQSKVSNLSKPTSIDQSTDAKLSDMKNTEVNTLIAMKGNRELLDASSSLTLVDDALARSTFDVDLDSRTTTSQEDTAKFPVKIIYKVDRGEMLTQKLDSDFTSNDDLGERKPKKRIYSPAKRDKHKQCTLSSLDVTPKPTKKMLKLSESPDGFKPIDVSQSAEKAQLKEEIKEEKIKKSPRKSKSKKPGTSITVQQLMTEYKVGPIDHNTLDEQLKDAIRDSKSDGSSIEPIQTASQSDVQDCNSLDMVSSFTSSKNLRDDRSGVTSSQSSKVSRMDWQPDLIEDLRSQNVSECDSSDNVVAKIDMLPFMGSHECEWESSSGDTWAFRLLHCRLRLAVRLAHRHDNAARTRVRADTPVRAVALETLPHDTKNTLAALCVSFAAETMRYFVSRGCACAGEVPALVRRCAGGARLAARWARAMSDARAHLAYRLAPDAALTLKVANVPLRCVWEVSMRLELVVGDAREAPWVRAGGVRVRRVLPAGEPGEPGGVGGAPRVLAHLPRDWSHAPRTIWRIFKYLKHKTRDDDDDLFMEMSKKS